MTSLERRKLCCSVTFHIIAVTCVVWSLYVLIDRTATEIRSGLLQWPFWTKLVVVAIGFTGGLVFMYIQCKVYVHLCRKWKAYNRIIVVQDAPEGIHKNRSSGLPGPRPPGSRNGSVKSVEKDDSTHPRGSPTNSRSQSVVDENEINNSQSESRRASEPPPGLTMTSTSRNNAETQTALRGMSIREMIISSEDPERGNNSDLSGDLSVVTVSRILEDISHDDNATIFFTEREDSGAVMTSSNSSRPVSSNKTKDVIPCHQDPLLICDLLPGHLANPEETKEEEKNDRD
jgi:hypothetical protein